MGLNAVKIQPKLGMTESERLQNLDFLDCKTADFLMFSDYMIAPKVFEPFLEDKNKNYVNEINMQLAMRKLNLFAKTTDKKLIYQIGNYMKNFDYESVLNLGLKNKCNANELVFNSTKDSSLVNNARKESEESKNINIATGPSFNGTSNK